FYETASFVPTKAVAYIVININATTGNNFTLTNNYIGGSAPDCGGTAWTKTGAFDNQFTSIYLSAATGTESSVQGNTIKNFVYTNAGSSNWSGIVCTSSTNANIGTISGNTIGSATGTGSILFTAASTSVFSGIYIASTGIGTIVNIKNNIIGAITTANSDAGYATSLYGINLAGTAITTTVSNNTIGSTTTPGSINASSTSTLNPQMVYGIYNTGASSTTTITGNTISNMRNGTTGTVTGRIVGIGFMEGVNSVADNTIRDLTISNNNVEINEISSVIGILARGSSGNQSVTGNTIFSLSNSYDAFAGNVIGIMCTGASTLLTVSKNFIHSLSVTGANSTTASIYGIFCYRTPICSNNIITLGGNTTTDLYGIYVFAIEGYKLYYNTVYLSGTVAGGALNKSYGLYSSASSSTRDFRNNIFNNARSTTGGASLHYAVYCNYSTSTKLTIDKNDYYATGTGAMIGKFGTDKSTLGDWKAATGQDAGSLSVSPGFASAGGTAALNYFPSATLPGVAIDGITTDIEGTTRKSPSTMGAFEKAVTCINLTDGGEIGTAQTICTGGNPALLTNKTTPTGDAGSSEYQWQSSSDNSVFTNITTGTFDSSTFDAGTLTVTIW
ncbi:MAG: hypothetical protein WCJ96_11380, partial [Verrucomicrobiota bacterium]